jgi:hypothetical protein
MLRAGYATNRGQLAAGVRLCPQRARLLSEMPKPTFEAERVNSKRPATRLFRDKTRASSQSCAVGSENQHTKKQHAREPGDVWSATTHTVMRPAREGPTPHGGRARSGRTGPRHGIDEPNETEEAIFGGTWGEKGAGHFSGRRVKQSLGHMTPKPVQTMCRPCNSP